MSDKVSGGANSRSSLRVILRKSRVECIWSGLPQIASVHADIAESSVSANSRLMRRSKMRLLDHLVGASEAGSAANRGRAPWRSSD
jgi:hypothetical protein